MAILQGALLLSSYSQPDARLSGIGLYRFSAEGSNGCLQTSVPGAVAHRPLIVSVSKFDLRSSLLTLGNPQASLGLLSLNRSLQVPSPSNHRPYIYLTTIFLRQAQDKSFFFDSCFNVSISPRMRASFLALLHPWSCCSLMRASC